MNELLHIRMLVTKKAKLILENKENKQKPSLAPREGTLCVPRNTQWTKQTGAELLALTPREVRHPSKTRIRN